MSKPEVDWTKFEKYAKSEIQCRCGSVYRSHAKGVSYEGRFMTVTKEPCPGCGADHDHAKRVSSEPESMTIRRDDVS